MAAGRKAEAGLITGILICLCILLSGCTQPTLLSQREIVHGIFFQGVGAESTVVLLLADTSREQEGGAVGYKTASGTGATPAQALERAESSLDGQVFYGLMDLVVLPSESDWQTISRLGRLLYEKAHPAPQFTIFLMNRLPADQLVETAAEVYEQMEDAVAKYGIRNGLQLMLSAENECALPLWQGTDYGFVFLQKDRPNTVLENALCAQLAAILCGQADRFQCDFSQGNGAVQAQTMVQHRVSEQGRCTLYLTLDTPDLQELGAAGRDEEQLRQALCKELEQDFQYITTQCCAPGFDPLRMGVWYWAACGSGEPLPVPCLEIAFEA